MKAALSAKTDDPLAAHRLTLQGGDAEAGRAVFTGHAQAQCIRCHKIRGEGGTAGPDLTGPRGGLRQQPLFACLSDAHCDTLLARAKPARFGRGEKIIEQGHAGDSMFLLLRGEADVLVRHNDAPARVASLRAGDCFGEMSLLTGEKRSATVIARTDCDILEIARPQLAEVLHHQPELLVRLSELLARRRLETEGILAENPSAQVASERQREYTQGFLGRLRSFFEL